MLLRSLQFGDITLGMTTRYNDKKYKNWEGIFKMLNIIILILKNPKLFSNETPYNLVMNIFKVYLFAHFGLILFGKMLSPQTKASNYVV